MFTLKGRTMVITGGAGNNGLAMINAALEAGMNGHLAKPYDIPAIMDTLKKLLLD